MRAEVAEAWPIFLNAKAAAARTRQLLSCNVGMRAGTAAVPILPNAAMAAERTFLSLSWNCAIYASICIVLIGILSLEEATLLEGDPAVVANDDMVEEFDAQ